MAKHEEEENSYEITLPEPHKNQIAVLESNARYKVLCCGRQFGKTLIATIIAIEAMVDGKQVAYVTPEFSLGKQFFRQLQQRFPKGLISEYNKSELYLELKGGGSLRFFSGGAVDSFRGLQFDLVIIDEAAKIPDLSDAWAAIRPTLMAYQGKAIIISTPKGRNFFYRLYERGVRKEAGFESWHFSSYDNPALPPGEVESMMETFTEAQIQEEIYAEPMADGSNPFGIEHILDGTIKELSTEPTIVYGIDFGFTHDYTVIVGLDANGHMTHFERFQKNTALTLQVVQNLPADTLKVVDSTGLGLPIFQQLQQSTNNIRGFVFTGQSKPAIINQLINDVQKGNVKFNEMTAQEMMSFEANPTHNSYIKYEAAKGAHDDCIMALAMANHHRYIAYSNTNWKLHFT